MRKTGGGGKTWGNSRQPWRDRWCGRGRGKRGCALGPRAWIGFDSDRRSRRSWWGNRWGCMFLPCCPVVCWSRRARGGSDRRSLRRRTPGIFGLVGYWQRLRNLRGCRGNGTRTSALLTSPCGPPSRGSNRSWSCVGQGRRSTIMGRLCPRCRARKPSYASMNETLPYTHKQSTHLMTHPPSCPERGSFLVPQYP